MALDRPHYLPPLHLRAEGTDSDRNVDPAHVPLPRTADSAKSNDTSTVGLGRNGSITSRSRTPHTGVATVGHAAPRSPSAYSTTFTLTSTSGAQAQSVSPPSLVSSTHAGGILPSASFFHPSRPTFYTDFGPISNFNNHNFTYNAVPLSSVPRSNVLVDPSDSRPESAGSDSFAQASITSDEPGSNGNGKERAGLTSNTNASAGTSVPSRNFSTKVSREPLLPIGQKPKPPVLTRPTVNRSTSGHKAPGIGGHGKWSEGNGTKRSDGEGIYIGGRVRTSLEKFLRRTLSGDTQMADSAFAKGSRLPTNMEDLESRDRDEDEPYFEIKSSSGVMIDEEGTMNITSNANASSSLSRRKRNSLFQPLFPDFNPVPPSTQPPASRTPVLDPSGKYVQKYRLHPSRNTFFFKGRFLTGGDSVWPFVCSVIVLLGIAGAWSGTTAVWWWKHESPAVAIIGAYMCLITIANMMATAFSDPGILPRNLDPDPPYPNTLTSNSGVQAPLPRDLKVRSGVVRVKYCQACRIYRPPRSSHCRMCDNCVDGCDHHCQWVNNCVGRRNYTSFILLLTSATLTLCLIICTSALHLVIQAHDGHISAGESLRRGASAGSAVVFIMGAIVIWPVGGLLGYHLRLLLLNLTTIEQIRNSAHKTLVDSPAPPNPFALGNWRHNLAEMLCRAQGMSWLEAAEIATEDRREPNPGAEIEEATGKEQGT
ncbi:DHHC palmitoyltransferase-domain-containing protein [Phellopilus nigrolimitatus]|nr:DHHC palmitoyltransferase-domain-containing protein [Phellopilus nigrolimitatus]